MFIKALVKYTIAFESSSTSKAHKKRIMVVIILIPKNIVAIICNVNMFYLHSLTQPLAYNQ